MELSEIIKRTNKKDPAPADKAALAQYMVEHGATEIARAGALHQHVQIKILGEGNSYFVQQGVIEHMKAQQADLGYAAASPLERLLIDNILLTWLRYHFVELSYTQVQQESSARAWHWERRLTQAHRRYLRSLEALAKVRRLLYRPDPPKTAFNILLRQQLGG